MTWHIVDRLLAARPRVARIARAGGVHLFDALLLVVVLLELLGEPAAVEAVRRLCGS